MTKFKSRVLQDLFFTSNISTGKFPFDYVSETQHYVRPIQHQKLTEFCKNLTGITQGQVDNGADLRATLLLYHDWLHVNGLVGNDITTTYSTKSNGDNVISNNSSSIGYGSTGSNSSSSSNNIGDSISMDIKDNCDRKVEKKSVIAAPTLQSKTVFPSFCIITWGDSDIGTILKEQCIRHSIELPSYFGEWINLKSTFKRHFGWEPHGGLQRVVERCGFSFDGRAHSGLVDSVNTAKIVKKMLKEGFQFFGSTSQIRTYGFRGKREPGENQKHRNIFALSSTLL